MAERCAFYYYDSSFWSNSSDCCRLLEQKGREYRSGHNGRKSIVSDITTKNVRTL